MKDEIDQFFERERERFRYQKPPEGHEDRFVEKLKARNGKGGGAKVIRILRNVAVAASLAVLLIAGGMFLQQQLEPIPGGSNEQLARTQNHFTSLISEKVEHLESYEGAGHQRLVSDAMQQLEKLDRQQQRLREDLRRNSGDPRIFQALITNYQTQIELLRQVLDQIENKEKKNEYESREI